MFLKPVTVVAGLLAASATTTYAFLIPPQIAESDLTVADAFDIIAPEISETQVIKVDCPGCPVVFHGKHGGRPKVKTDKANHLELSFVVDHLADADRLLLNGFELYPSPDPFHEVLTAPQVLDKKKRSTEGERKEKRHRPDHGEKKKHHGHHEPVALPLGFGLQVSPATKDADTELELVTLDLQIIEVGPVFVDGIPSVRIDLIKHRNGRLMIGNIKTVAAPEPAYEPTQADKTQPECDSMLCEWLAAFQDQIKKLSPGKPCHGVKSGAAASGDEPHHGHGHGHHGPSHWHHRPASHEHSWGQLAKNIASHILLPVLIGIVAGVSVSL